MIADELLYERLTGGALDMPGVRIIETTAQQWGIRRSVSPVLRQAGGLGQTVPPASGSHAGRYSPSQRRAQTGGNPSRAQNPSLADLALSYPHEFGEFA